MSTPITTHTQKTITVLLLDDDITFAKIVQHHLQKFQNREFKLIWKETVETGLQEVQQNPLLDLILTDYKLQDSNGLEFCLQVSQINPEIPIIFITGTRDFKLAIDAMKLGVEDFLIKEDLTESLLPRTIINLLDRVRMRKQITAVEKRMLIAEKRAEAIRELVVTVCHEFNNPLAAIKISADLIKRQQLPEDDKTALKNFEENFLKIESEIKRLRDINFEKIDFHSSSLEKGSSK
ncbi:MAG: response regulator [Ignavibacteriales bacterium]|nr:response regulator [Ignavibacteriales bacterium]MBI3787805.1 response regulator [Ignavibacteriales bacterium]